MSKGCAIRVRARTYSKWPDAKNTFPCQLGGNQFAFTRVKRAYIDAISLGICGTAPIREVEEMFAVGQEEGPAIGLNAALAHYPSRRERERRRWQEPGTTVPSGSGPNTIVPSRFQAPPQAKRASQRTCTRIAGDVDCS